MDDPNVLMLTVDVPRDDTDQRQGNSKIGAVILSDFDIFDDFNLFSRGPTHCLP